MGWLMASDRELKFNEICISFEEAELGKAGLYPPSSGNLGREVNTANLLLAAQSNNCAAFEAMLKAAAAIPYDPQNIIFERGETWDNMYKLLGRNTRLEKALSQYLDQVQKNVEVYFEYSPIILYEL